VPWGGGLDRRAPRDVLDLDPRQLVVLTLGRLTGMKAQRYLDAVPALGNPVPDVAVVIIGEGHLREPLAKRAAELGITDHVRLVGHRSDARTLLDATDVFTIPFHHEGMPLVLLGAMDAGLSVVATRVIGGEEVVVDGENGIVVSGEDPAALSSALMAPLADHGLRVRHGEAERRRYLERFTARRMADATLTLYEHALQDAAAGTVHRST
jgi:glycosyltransferase involved in cell wall biosynthesis